MIDFSKRITSSFGVSIGTGLMLESLFKPTHDRYDESRAIPNEVKVSEYKYHFFNLMTLARNVCSSFDAKIEHEVYLRDKGFSECLNEEVNIIHSLYAGSGCEPVFYYCNFDKLEARLNAGKNRDKTKPIIENSKLYKILKKIDIAHDWLVDGKILTDIEKLPAIPREHKCLMTTSFCIDTFAKMNLDLIDSHTGILYKKDKFYNKYYQIGSKDMSVFPHYEILLYYLGDVSMSGIIDVGTRLAIYAIATANGWNSKTSQYAVDSGIKSDLKLRPYFSGYKKLY